MGIKCIIIIDNDPIGHYNIVSKSNTNNKQGDHKMTVKQLHDMTSHNTTIYILWAGNMRELNRDNILDLSAYGNYVIDEIQAIERHELMARIKVIPATV